jgi:outer membrane protein assembly factor BamC
MYKWMWLLLLLGGCTWMSDDRGWFIDRSKEYLKVSENPPLAVPDELDTERLRDPTPIPTIATPLKPEYYPSKPPRPDAIHGSDARDEVRIQRLGDRRWLAVPEDPTTVWPKVKQFFAENGVSLAREMPAAGRLDTEWLVVGNEPYRDVVRLAIRDAKDAATVSGGQDRVRIRIEPGLRERTSEIHVRHENDAFSPPGPDDLVELLATPSHIVEAEQDLLNEVGAYIAARVAEQTVSMVALDMSAGVKSFLDRDAGGDPVLRLVLDYQRAWATVGQSLSRANIEVETSDEASGRYVINVPPSLEVGEPRKRGLVRRMFTFGRNDLKTVELHIEPFGDGTYVVSATGPDGGALDREFGQEVLVLVREFSS